MRDQDPPVISYLAIFFVVLLAVTLGNLLSTWIAARAAAYVAEQAMAEAARVFTETQKRVKAQTDAMMQRNAEAQRQAHLQTRAQRANSPTGTKLARQCHDWHRAYDQLRSDTALHEKNKHCSAYESFLETGAVPRQ